MSGEADQSLQELVSLDKGEGALHGVKIGFGEDQGGVEGRPRALIDMIFVDGKNVGVVEIIGKVLGGGKVVVDFSTREIIDQFEGRFEGMLPGTLDPRHLRHLSDEARGTSAEVEIHHSREFTLLTWGTDTRVCFGLSQRGALTEGARLGGLTERQLCSDSVLGLAARGWTGVGNLLRRILCQ